MNSEKIWKMWKKSKSNSKQEKEIMEETQVEYRKDSEKYVRNAS
jgi:ribulose bisphosphate carboxylase small subunit